MAQATEAPQSQEATTIKIYRTAATVKGGRRFSFGALVAVGDRQGQVGLGYGKGPGVPAAIEKAQKDARKTMVRVQLQEGTLPHRVIGRFGASKVKLIPASPGTGVIAGATVRAVLELAGVQDCLTKSMGSANQKNLAKAVMEGLLQLQSKDRITGLREVDLESSIVDEKLAAGRRYAPTRTAETAAAPKAKQESDDKSKGKGKGKGKSKGRGQSKGNVQATGGVKSTRTDATAAKDEPDTDAATIAETPQAPETPQTAESAGTTEAEASLKTPEPSEPKVSEETETPENKDNA